MFTHASFRHLAVASIGFVALAACYTGTGIRTAGQVAIVTTPRPAGLLRYQQGKAAFLQRRYKKVLSHWTKAAEEGNAKAMCSAGLLYCKGWGAPRNYPKALALYRKAAKGGNVHAMYEIGLLYAHGWGVRRDYVKAMARWRRATAKGDPQAMYCIGALYTHGWGTRRNYHQAMTWYRRAAAKGNAGAMYGLGYLYGHGLGVPQGRQEALTWFRRAAAAGDRQAMGNLGWRRPNAGTPESRMAFAVLFFLGLSASLLAAIFVLAVSFRRQLLPPWQKPCMRFGLLFLPFLFVLSLTAILLGEIPVLGALLVGFLLHRAPAFGTLQIYRNLYLAVLNGGTFLGAASAYAAVRWGYLSRSVIGRAGRGAVLALEIVFTYAVAGACYYLPLWMAHGWIASGQLGWLGGAYAITRVTEAARNSAGAALGSGILPASFGVLMGMAVGRSIRVADDRTTGPAPPRIDLGGCRPRPFRHWAYWLAVGLGLLQLLGLASMLFHGRPPGVGLGLRGYALVGNEFACVVAVLTLAGHVEPGVRLQARVASVSAALAISVLLVCCLVFVNVTWWNR
jgi:TPR repeat protein